MPITDKEYQQLSDQALKRVLKAFDDEDPDEIEAESIPGVVTLQFGDGKKFILNRQPSVHQLWLAGGASGWHFDYDAEKGEWLSDKTHEELFALIERLVAGKVGRTITV
jgi:CyaY protein